MLIGDFLLVELRADILGNLQGLVHFLSEFLDAYGSTLENADASASSRLVLATGLDF